MGDHRSISSDSRDFGPVDRELIYGKAVFVYWPMEQVGVVRYDGDTGCGVVNTATTWPRGEDLASHGVLACIRRSRIEDVDEASNETLVAWIGNVVCVCRRIYAAAGGCADCGEGGAGTSPSASASPPPSSQTCSPVALSDASVERNTHAGDRYGCFI